MDTTAAKRVQFAMIGALAGMSFYLLSKIVDQGIITDRSFLALATFTGTFFTGLLALIGPLAVVRSALSTAALALATTVLFVWASFRNESLDNYFFSPFPVLATLVIATVPLPFFIAAAGPGWRDYPALFAAAWTIVVRYAAAWIFVGVVWGVIYLSDMLLSIVGLHIIETLIAIDFVPFLVTGLTLGLALAVVEEMKDFVSPYLILRLLRLLLPVVLLVLVVFVVALPIQGFSAVFGELSVAATLLVMTGASASLITTAIDQSDPEATQSPLLARATQALALILPLPAGLAAYSVWLRVDQYGWTPDRLFAALMAILAFGYGFSYASAILRGRNWMARIRQSNIMMSLVGVAAAVLWLTPILNADRVSANSQLHRFQSGRTSLADLDIRQFGDWGRAGSAALAELESMAKEPGQEALATALINQNSTSQSDVAADPAKLLTDLKEAMPLQPVSATADRDQLLASLDPYDIASWLTACRTPMADGKPGCVMVVADINQIYEGNEALVVLRDFGDSIRYEALVRVNSSVERRTVSTLTGYLPYDAAGAQIITEMQAAPPVLAPIPLNQVMVGTRGLTIFP